MLSRLFIEKYFLKDKLTAFAIFFEITRVQGFPAII